MRKNLFFLFVFLILKLGAQIPKPSFAYSYVTGPNKEIIVNYLDNSEGDQLQYQWEFPGATIDNSIEKNPKVIYSNIGDYIVNLKITSSTGESSLSKKITITGDTNGQTINLSTGMNEDDTTMSTDGVPDTDWTVTNPSGVTGVPVTRVKYNEWYEPWFENNLYSGKTTWIKSGNLYSDYGDYYYKSKTFIIPDNSVESKLTYKALAFVRHWSYLVRINNDGSETDIKEVSRTLWLDDGAKGWFNSRTSSVEDEPLAPGKYYIRARVFTNNGSLRDALSVNGSVKIGNTIKLNSLNLPALGINKIRICANLSEYISFDGADNLDNTHTFEWIISNVSHMVTSNLKSPSFNFNTLGTYDVGLKIKKDGLSSDYIFKNQIIVESCKQPVDKNLLAAPNSFIYDIDLAKTNNYGGLYIPVKKAYDVWDDVNGYLNQTIPGKTQSVSVVWEDKENIIEKVSIVGTGETAKLKIDVNSIKGKGNAVVALHVGDNGNDSDPIYWSWHVWITDSPENGITYTNNGEARMINTFMDRNLGALSKTFLGNDWNKSGGLLYQWGRKDPIPRMLYTDASKAEFFTKEGRVFEVNKFIEKWSLKRIYNSINENIKYTVNNPLKFIIRTENAGAWFASDLNNKKIKGNDGYAIENYDLWGDNNKGVTKKESFEKQVKSPYDPCPSGWRVPSFAHSDSTIPKYSPWGSNYNYVYNENRAYPITESRSRYPNVKFYPGMGVDFKNGEDHHELGTYSTTGAFKLLESGRLSFQDTSSETAIW